MKKIYSIFAITVLLISFTACSYLKDPYIIYKDAIEKIRSLDSLEMDTNVQASLNIKEATCLLDMNMNMKCIELLNENPTVLLKMDNKMLDNHYFTNYYYSDGIKYIDTQKEKIKSRIHESEIKLLVQLNAGLLTIPKDEFIDIDAKKDGENTIITYRVDGSKTYGKSLDYVFRHLGVKNAFFGADICIEDASGTITIDKEGYITKHDIRIKMKITMFGVKNEQKEADEDFALLFQIEGSYVNPGHQPVIVLPGDFGSYTEVDE